MDEIDQETDSYSADGKPVSFSMTWKRSEVAAAASEEEPNPVAGLISRLVFSAPAGFVTMETEILVLFPRRRTPRK